MSATEDMNSNKDEDSSLLKEEAADNNMESDSTPAVQTSEKIENVPAKSDDAPQIDTITASKATKEGSGDTNLDISSTDVKNSSPVKEQVDTDSKQGSGDHTDSSKILDQKKPHVPSPKTDKPKLDEFEDLDDEELELKWDDDENDQVIDNDNLETPKETMSEEELLQEPESVKIETVSKTSDNNNIEKKNDDDTNNDVAMEMNVAVPNTTINLATEKAVNEDILLEPSLDKEDNSNDEKMNKQTEDELLQDSPTQEVAMETDNTSLDEIKNISDEKSHMEIDESSNPNASKSSDLPDQDSSFKQGANINLKSPMHEEASLDSPLRLDESSTSDSPVEEPLNNELKPDDSTPNKGLSNVVQDNKSSTTQIAMEVKDSSISDIPKADKNISNVVASIDIDSISAESSKEISDNSNIDGTTNIVADTDPKEMKETVKIDTIISKVIPIDNIDKNTAESTSPVSKETESNNTNITKTASKDIPAKMTSSPEQTKGTINVRKDLFSILKPDITASSTPTKIQLDLSKDQSLNQSKDMSLNSSMYIKTDHGLHKPDVMLEIPTQELIDFDDTDVSMNLDCSRVNVSKENVDSGIKIVEETSKVDVEENVSTNQDKTETDEGERKADYVDVQPSTSKGPESTFLIPDTSDEVPEMEDSLGLLAESSGRMMEDDDEPDEDDDDDDDFDQDESSNQVSAEHSDDSNAPHSEMEPMTNDDHDIETHDHEVGTHDNDVETHEHDVDIKDEEILVPSSGNETKDDKDNIEEMEEQSTTDEVEKVQEQLQKAVNIQESSEESKEKSSDNCDSGNNAGTSETAVETLAEVTKKIAEDKPQETVNISPKQSPSKLKNLQISTQAQGNIVNIVDLEESSSEEDILEVKTKTADKPEAEPKGDDVTVKIPPGIDITSTKDNSEVLSKEGELVISAVQKPQTNKTPRLNTSEVTIKTTTNAESTLVIPEAKSAEPQATPKSKLSLEIFSLDSDEEESSTSKAPSNVIPPVNPTTESEKVRGSKCINYACPSGPGAATIVADVNIVLYYDAGRKRRAMVCAPCEKKVHHRTRNLVAGIKDLTPLMDLQMDKVSQELVRISDSESEDEEPVVEEPKESIGEKSAKLLEESLAELLNETWRKYDLDARLNETRIVLDAEIEKLDKESQEIDQMLKDCQLATDKLRNDLYATFEHKRKELLGWTIIDTPEKVFIGPETSIGATTTQDATDVQSRLSKRRLGTPSEPQAKRPAIPLGYAPLDSTTQSDAQDSKPGTSLDTKMEEDKDISVVNLSAEAAPADLPPPGDMVKPALRVGMHVYAMKNAFGPWLKGKIIEFQSKRSNPALPFTMCRVKFDHKLKGNSKVLPARCIAYYEPANVRMTIGTRLIALFKGASPREPYYSGVVAEIPNPVNNFRYLVFFDDGYAQYVPHKFTRLVCESSSLVWEEVHPFSREFVKEYLLAYPERPMVRLHEGQHLKTEWNGKWWSSKVIKVDASLARVKFVEDGRCEWIYRGSTRLAPLYLELKAAEKHRVRPMTRRAPQATNMPYVEYTRSDEQASKNQQETENQQQQNEEFRRQRAVAKKSTAPSTPAPSAGMSAPSSAPPRPIVNQMPGIIDPMRGCSRVVYYTPKNAVKPLKIVPHDCGPKCKRTDVLSLKELRTYNPLAKPLLSGWERQVVRFRGNKEVLYRAPCGRRLRNMPELHKYLRITDSELPVDLFDFHTDIHCLAEFVLNKCIVGKKDLSHGKENVPVPCVNYYDDQLPEFCSYNTERTPTAGVPLNLDPDFLCGCDCTDDCEDKSKCACWKMTLEGAKTIHAEGTSHGYEYKRLPVPLPSGIYECNSKCKCKQTCLNRVAQHPLQLKLQVFKTLNRGWGIRALNDVPKGSFLCVYAGNLLTDATANLDGLNEGDEYLAELDYIEVVEQMKEGYEDDIPEADKKLDKKESEEDSEEDEEESEEEDDKDSKFDKEDDDFRPTQAIGLGTMTFNKRLRKRDKKKVKEDAEKDSNTKEKDSNTKEKDSIKEGKEGDEDCITISDDEEVREPSRFTAQAGMEGDFVSKYRSVRSYFGKDEACYIMDAKVQGNIGRYLNHSCSPNVFVQNVFVDTHDPRFPWVAFFALHHIKAGTELTWNYNYDVGSVPGKALYCYCGAPNCRGRLL